ncbi:MAG: hypothetical protein WC699_17980 [Bacteroidales bacterium]|jgi:hypothetical protein
MKKNLLQTGIILLAAVAICSSCNQRPKATEDKVTNSKGQIATVEVGGYDPAKLAKMIVETIKASPKSVELINFLNGVGVSYMSNLTVPLQNVEKYLTVVDQSFAFGMYLFDQAYANSYKRDDAVAQLSVVNRTLMKKLGLEGNPDLTEAGTRFKQNQSNADSLNVIVRDYWNKIGSSTYTMEHPGVIAQFYIGLNIEGLYILTQVALMSKDNATLINFIGKQKERIQANYSVLEMTAADAAVAPIFEKMKPIMNYFNNNQEFTAKQLGEVGPMIEQIRKELVK